MQSHSDSRLAINGEPLAIFHFLLPYSSKHTFCNWPIGFKMYKQIGDQLFNINFHINRTRFKLQHQVLQYIKEHASFSILIKNSLYECNACEVVNLSCELNFQFPDTLNKEQKMAKNIAQASNRQNPCVWTSR